MRHETRKIAKIIDELTTFCLEHGAEQIGITIKNEEDRTCILLEVSHLNNIEKTILRLKEVLSYPCERELEEYYWELAGESDSSEELSLVGTMIDEVTIDYDEEMIKLELIRLKRV